MRQSGRWARRRPSSWGRLRNLRESRWFLFSCVRGLQPDLKSWEQSLYARHCRSFCCLQLQGSPPTLAPRNEQVQGKRTKEPVLREKLLPGIHRRSHRASESNTGCLQIARVPSSLTATTRRAAPSARPSESDFVMVPARRREAKPAPNANRMTGPKLFADATPTK